jgi:hypothetical protein
MAPLRGPQPPMSLRYAIWSFLSATLGILAIYGIPGDVCNTFMVTYQKSKEFDDDFHTCK